MVEKWNLCSYASTEFHRSEKNCFQIFPNCCQWELFTYDGWEKRTLASSWSLSITFLLLQPCYIFYHLTEAKIFLFFGPSAGHLYLSAAQQIFLYSACCKFSAHMGESHKAERKNMQNLVLYPSDTITRAGLYVFFWIQWSVSPTIGWIFARINTSEKWDDNKWRRRSLLSDEISSATDVMMLVGWRLKL